MTKKRANLSLAIGLMSGTSCDGVDAALIESDGERIVRSIASTFLPYRESEQALLRQALLDAHHLSDRSGRPGILAQAEEFIINAHNAAIRQLMDLDVCLGLKPDIVGFHGQTVWHDPAQGVTIQIGDGQKLADLCGMKVVYDFRAADVAAGGQGAPLVPIYHKVLQEASLDALSLPLAVVNIGGVANMTWIGRTGSLIAFDTGPGNALINDWVFSTTGKLMDKDGAIAACGTIDFMALLGLMRNPYFSKAAPKSLDRNGFDLSDIEPLCLEDGAATLTAFTVQSLCLGLEQMEMREGEPARMLIICGGGRHNAFMMAQLNEALDIPIKGAEEIGWQNDALEAEAFAYLAIRSEKGLPITFPETTGIRQSMSGGVLCHPRSAR